MQSFVVFKIKHKEGLGYFDLNDSEAEWVVSMEKGYTQQAEYKLTLNTRLFVSISL